MLFAGLLVLIGVILLLVWLTGGRKNSMLRNTGLVTAGTGILLAAIGLVLYFTTS
jgi:hypothetical protein